MTAKQIRKRISKLKSELKNSRNFFQKTKLQQEINALEKKYKEINRNAKKFARIKRKIAESSTILNYYRSMPASSTDSYITANMRDLII